MLVEDLGESIILLRCRNSQKGKRMIDIFLSVCPVRSRFTIGRIVKTPHNESEQERGASSLLPSQPRQHGVQEFADAPETYHLDCSDRLEAFDMVAADHVHWLPFVPDVSTNADHIQGFDAPLDDERIGISDDDLRSNPERD